MIAASITPLVIATLSAHLLTATVPSSPMPVMYAMGSEQTSERKLDDVAVIELPKSLKEEFLKGMRTDQADRLMFSFGKSYFWASFGGITRYKQLLVVSIIAPDAAASAYEMRPKTMTVSWPKPRVVHNATKGTGTITVTAGNYEAGSNNYPSHLFEYRDRSRRLQIVWHATESEVSLAAGIALLEKMATSFRIVSDPVATFTHMRERPMREAADRVRRLALAKEMLAKAGYANLVAERPVFRNGMYMEWTSDPEPRYQMLVPLGVVKATMFSPTGVIPQRPAPLTNAAGDTVLEGVIGWYAFIDGAWEFHNGDNAYLPFAGVSAVLKVEHVKKDEVLYYYSATVRVEEEEPDTRLTSLQWFTNGIAEVQRQWRDGKIVPWPK